MTLGLICMAAGAALLAGWLFAHYCRNKKQIGKRLLFNLLAGGAALTLMNALSGLTGLAVPLNSLSLAAAALLGTPGVLGLYAVKLFL